MTGKDLKEFLNTLTEEELGYVIVKHDCDLEINEDSQDLTWKWYPIEIICKRPEKKEIELS